ncbi:MAG: hypothetical protein JO020_19635 [Chloroflexi bacterium]|nr:hypothetical protein [Chloroflexota bacterium]
MRRIPPDADALAAAFDLGSSLAPPDQVATGWGGHNLLWRLSTTCGTWAIKEVGRELALDPQATLALELATLVGHAGFSGGDRDAAGAVALRETGGDQVEAALLLEHARRGALELLESTRTWTRVERLAAVLQRASTVDGDEVRRLGSLA